ncbi:Erythroid membrane-associated protein [Labeo rohita]|uniref:Erythroid membrane-associated protein n=1 Tax=Labeo rohita TaxID=84645 RepID=A0ABQ8L9A7_LABRO|nr:Erythroid membrane-associated protein [Labeo rohita]
MTLNTAPCGHDFLFFEPRQAGDTEDNHTSYYDGDDGRFRGRLELDSKTGSLTITDLETKHTGEFRLKIISDRRILFKRFTVSVSGLSPGAVAGICVIMLLVAAAVATSVVIYYRRRDSELQKLIHKPMSHAIKSDLYSWFSLPGLIVLNSYSFTDETQRPEIRESERQRFIFVEETAISKAFGPDKRLRDRQGRKRIAIRAENEEVHAHDFADDVKISEQETSADATKEEATRPEIREGHFSHGIEGGKNAVPSQSPPSIPAGARLSNH